MPERDDLTHIHTLLSEGFTAEELRQFCLNTLEFRPVYDRLSPTSSKAEIIGRLVEYADQTAQVDELLALVKEPLPVTDEPSQADDRPSPGRDLVGRTLGKYYIVEWLSRGGVATVYKAYQPGLYRYVAVKVIHHHLAGDEDFVERFEREAIAVAGLRHPNIVQVFDFDLAVDLYYMVMEFVDGPTLEAELAEREEESQLFSLAELVTIFTALASAVDYAHSRGVIHRDLKPSNILFTAERRVVLTDFGIARIVGAPSYTLTGEISGTPAYMSPEQALGREIDERSDIYSLGVILYEMTTGRHPFEGSTPVAMLLKHTSGPVPLPTTVKPDLSQAVEQVILRALSKDASARFQTATEMARALQEAVERSSYQTQEMTTDQATEITVRSSRTREISSIADLMVEQLIGQALNDRYQITSLLGSGGMGTVLKSRDVVLERDVAIKIMHPHFAQQPDLQERFLQEARAAARLNHAGIAQVFDFGQVSAFLYIVMELIPGHNLHRLLQDLRRAGRWIRLPEAIQLTRQLCLALAYAHQQDVLHRDIKPNNIMLKPEPGESLPYQAVIMDLGLAKILTGESLTVSGTSLGTPAYMSPEQAAGQAIDGRSDIYSLGILLYELAVGQLPFPVKTIPEAIRYHTQEPPPPPRSVRPDLPQSLEQVILRALAKDPAGRFPEAAAMAQALADILPETATITSAPTALAEAVSLIRPIQPGSGDEQPPEIQISIPIPPEQAGPAIFKREPVSQTIEVGGDVVQGDKVEGDTITTGHIAGSGIAIGREAQVTISQGVGGDELVRLFEAIYQQIKTRPEDSDVDKEELTETVAKIQQEVAQGEQANPKKVERWLDNLTQIAPDIANATATRLLQPGANVPPPIRQIAAKAGTDPE